MPTIFSLFYCLHTSSIFILGQLLVEYSIYSNKRCIQKHLEVWHLLERRLLLEEDAYFNVESQRCCAYQRQVLVRGKLYFVLFFLANFKEEEGIKQDGCSILSVCLRRKYFFGLLVFSFTIYMLRHLRNDRNILKTARVH